MKKYNKILFLFMFSLLMILSINVETASAAVGDRMTPYRAFTNHRITYEVDEGETPKVIETQLLEIYTGEEANTIIQNEYDDNTVPASDEQWILMEFNLKYISGPEESLCAYEVFDDYDGLFTTSGQKISIVDEAYFYNNYEGFGVNDVELYPGSESKVYYGILVKKTVGFPLIRIDTDYSTYKWLSIDPNYYEPAISAPTSVKAESSSYSSIKTSWAAVSGATGYEVYRAASSTGTYSKIATVTGTSYNDTGRTTGTTYYYKIKAYKTVGTTKSYSGYSSVVSAKPINAETNSVAVGDRNTPYRAWTNNRFTLYGWDEPQVVEMELLQMYTGEEANTIIQNEYEDNTVPASDEQWILMEFNLKYISGPEGSLEAYYVLDSYDGLFTTSGQKISGVDEASFYGNYEGLGVNDVELYPGAESKVYYGILVKKTAGLPLIRIETYDESMDETAYKWFSIDQNYYEPIISAPTSVKSESSSYSSIKTSWAAVSGANGYEVYRAISSTGTYSKIATVAGTSYNDTGRTTGTTYYYKIKAYKTVGTTKSYSSYSSVVSAKPILSVPTSVKAVSSSYNSIKTSWTAVSGANGYEVYRATSSTGTYSKVGTVTGTSYSDTGRTTGTTYYYKVKAYRTVGTSKVYSSYSSVVSAKPILSVPTSVKAVSSSYNSIKTSWTAVSGANGYEVYRATSSTGTYSKVGTVTGTSYSDTGRTTGTTYYYKVKAYRTVGTSKVYSSYSSVVSAKPIPSVPTSVKAARASSTGIKITWAKVTGASGYQVYRATSKEGTYSSVKTTSNLYYTNTGLTTGKTYYYKVRAYKTVGTTKVYGSWSTIVYARP